MVAVLGVDRRERRNAQTVVAAARQRGCTKRGARATVNRHTAAVVVVVRVVGAGSDRPKPPPVRQPRRRNRWVGGGTGAVKRADGLRRRNRRVGSSQAGGGRRDTRAVGLKHVGYRQGRVRVV